MRSCPRRPVLFSQTCHRIGIDTFLSPVFYTAAPTCICIRRLAGAHHVSPAVLWTMSPEGGSEPLTSVPRSDFMAQPLFLSIDVCRDSESHRFELTFGWVFLRPILAQYLIRIIFLGIFFKRFVLIASGTKSCGQYLWNSNFFLATSRFRCHPSKTNANSGRCFTSPAAWCVGRTIGSQCCKYFYREGCRLVINALPAIFIPREIRDICWWCIYLFLFGQMLNFVSCVIRPLYVPGSLFSRRLQAIDQCLTG